MQSEAFLSVRSLRVEFQLSHRRRLRGGRTVLTAVDDVSFDVNEGETLGIVGESGSGKSTVARALVGLVQPTSGEMLFNGQDMSRISKSARRVLSRDIQIVFQDPYLSLNPRLTVGQLISEGWRIHRDLVPKQQWKVEIAHLLELVGLDAAHADRHPHQFSGGQRQRIGIARALALRPRLLICDEAVSALDVSIQAQILNLLRKLQKELGLTYIFIGHDLSVIQHIADRVMVMYLGRVREIGTKAEVFTSPAHPYTQALLSAIPDPKPWSMPPRERIVLVGDLPSPIDPPSGCGFRTRCWMAHDLCSESGPELRRISASRSAACHFAEDVGQMNLTAKE